MRRPSWFRCPWVSREWADTLAVRVEEREEERDAALAEVDVLKCRVLATEGRHDAAEGKRRQLARWLAEAEATNRRLKAELATARKEAAGGAAAELRAQTEAEKRRADGLQRRLDQALGLDAAAVALGETWQARREQKMRYDA